jgi:hypothetical protein
MSNQVSEDEFLDRIRTAYNDYPPYQRPLRPFPQRQPKTRRIAVIAAAAAGVALIPAVGALVAINSSDDSASAPGAPVAGGPPQATTHRAHEPTVEGVTDPHLVDRLYAELDAHPAYGFYMLKVSDDNHTVTLWRTTPAAAVEEALQSITAEAGYSITIKAVPPSNTWSASDQDALSTAANSMRDVLGASAASGFADLRIEVPLNTIVLWRTTPSEATDTQLQQIADEAGVQLELLTAPMSEADAQSLGRTLRADNDKWRALGFTVNGAYATGSGPVVVVSGDVTAASSALADRSDILTIEKDDGVPL